MRILLSQDNKEYRATLSDDQLTGSVQDLSGNVYPVKGSSPHKTKIAIKKQLELLGVVFELEKRSIADDLQ
jgi:hypothetical protein